MRRVDPCKDGVLIQAGIQLGIAESVQFVAGHRLFAPEQSCLFRNGGGGVLVIAGNHDRADVGSGAGADGSPGGFSGRIQHSGKPQTDAGAVLLPGKRQHPECLVGQLRHAPANSRTVALGKRHGLSVTHLKAAQRQDGIRCPFPVSTRPCALGDGDGHPPGLAVERL